MTGFRHGPRPTLGLIGSIGAGKSTVAARLAAAGAAVIDADKLGHAVLDEPHVRDALVARWGSKILDGDRANRKAIGRIVFADPAEKAALEAIVFPAIREKAKAAMAMAQTSASVAPVVLDAPLLLEAGWADLCDRVLLVDAPRTVRLARVAARSGWSDAELTAREANQLPLDTKRANADAVLVNDGTLDELDRTLTATFARWGWATAAPNG
jgi:dephospho-CoA kinase